MWLPRNLFDLFSISKDAVDALRTDNAILRIERDLLRADLASARANVAWMSVRVNALEVERGALLEKAYGVRVAIPEIVRATPSHSPLNIGDFFSDVGDDLAKEIGLPTYNS